MKLGYPKQFAKIAGKTVLEHTIDTFQKDHLIDEIIIVSKAEYKDKVLELVNNNDFNKVVKVLNGGSERTDSTKAAINALSNYSDHTKLIIHDSVRPLISSAIIRNCVSKLDQYNALDVVIPSADTIVVVNDREEVVDIPNRNRMRRGQTPQAFRLGVLRKAYDQYDPSKVKATCDCGIIMKTIPGEPIGTVEGCGTNIKLTEGVDMFLADKLFQSRGDSSLHMTTAEKLHDGMTGHVMVVVGGTYGIGKSIADIAEQLGAKVYTFSRKNGVDVSDLASVQKALQEVYNINHRIDYVVNSAAILMQRPLAHMTTEDIHTVMNVNMLGAINVSTASYKYLKETKGSLLNFTSSSYTRGRAFYSVYSATKAGVVNLTQALAEEWLNEGIRVNCINPERTKTPMRSNNFGFEPEHTLLSPDVVALASLSSLVGRSSGEIVDVRLKDSSQADIINKDLTTYVLSSETAA